MNYRSPFTDKATMTLAFKADGNYRAGFHTGEDWICDDRTLVSPCGGVVSYVGFDEKGYGNYLIIHTTDKKSILMAHMKERPMVSVGDKLIQGQKIGIMGSSGNSTGPHLHIEVQNNVEWNYGENLVRPSSQIDFNEYFLRRGFDLRLGDNNSYVFAYKLILIQLQAKGIIKQGVDANGIIGGGTHVATKELQKKLGVKQTGIADAKMIKSAVKLLK